MPGTAPELLSELLGFNKFAQGASQALAVPFVRKQVQESEVFNNHLNQAIVRKIQEARARGDQQAAQKLGLILMERTGQDFNLEDLATAGDGFVSNNQVAGGALNLGALAAVPAARGAAAPAVLGATGGLAQGISQGGSPRELAAKSAIGALTGAAAGTLPLGRRATAPLGAILGGAIGAQGSDAGSAGFNVGAGAALGALGGAIIPPGLNMGVLPRLAALILGNQVNK